MIDKFVGSLMIGNLIFGDLNSLFIIINKSKQIYFREYSIIL